MNLFYLHGFVSSAQAKRAVYLAERLRPFGLTLHSPDFNAPDFASMTMTRMIDQLTSDIAALDDQPIALIGSSLGAVIAILAAARLPDRIDRLILLAPAIMFPK